MLSVTYKIVPSSKLNKVNEGDVPIKQEPTEENHTAISQKPEKHYTIVSYGPVSVRVSQRSTPTLQSGRRSKFLPLEGEAARKRELKRAKNRRTAKKLKERQIRIELQLVNEISELQTKEKDLLGKINNLKSYKAFLEDRFQQQLCGVRETSLSDSLQEEPPSVHTELDPSTQCEVKRIKTEPRSPSPGWQLVFSI